MPPTLTENLPPGSIYVTPMSEHGHVRSKAVLFCAVCGHESPPDGDWTESTTTGTAGPLLVLACPECGETVTRRSTRPDRRVRAAVSDD